MSAKTRVNLYGGYDADKRLSMQIYAQSLIQGLKLDAGLEVALINPSSSLERFSRIAGIGKFVMRWLRYISFARWTRGFDADIHHVVDHGYAHLVPNFSGGKSVVTVHDLIPLLNWQTGFESDATSDAKENGAVVKKPVLNIHSLSYLHRFDQIVADSESTLLDLERYLNISRDKVAVVPVAIQDHFRILDKNEVARFSLQNNLDSSLRWIMISGQEFYKNHKTSLQVLKQLNERFNGGVRCLKTGVPTREFDALLDELDVRALVHQIYFENAEDLVLAYNFVDCVLFPSLYEGFGMPVVESLACGTPVVTSNRGSLKELNGEFVDHKEPFDVKGLADATAARLSQPVSAKFLRDSSSALLDKCSPKAVASQWATIYRGLASS